MQLKTSWTGTVAYNFAFQNSSFTTSITKMELSMPKFQATIAVNFTNLITFLKSDLTNQSKYTFNL